MERAVIPGFYVAWGPWLTSDDGGGILHKVGHTGNLARRLTDDAYTTCFPENHWKYVFTLETATADEASMIESGVLYLLGQMRLGRRELVRADEEQIRRVALNTASALDIAVTVRDAPVYPRPATLSDDSRLSNEAITKLDLLKVSAALGPVLASEPPPVSAPEPSPVPVSEPPPVLAPDGSDSDEDVPGWENPPEPETPLEIREYQRDAAEACWQELRRDGRTILQMACRCGKTPVAFEIIKRFLKEFPSDPVAFFVPGLHLLRQTMQKLSRYGLAATPLLVGSDPERVATWAGNLSMTTDGSVISAFLRRSGPRIVVATYQSSPLLGDAGFSLEVFDECHRTTGSAALRSFNYRLMRPRSGARLFMTATPSYDGEINMKNYELFGGIAYRYHLRRGIDAGYVNDFRLQVVSVPGSTGRRGADDAAPEQIEEAMKIVDKLLVFCRDTSHASKLAQACAGRNSPGVAPYAVFVVHSRCAGAAESLVKFATPGVRAAVFSVRMLQEGVEIPELNGVFFAAPRRAPRDIIQSVCRPLNRRDGKPPSVVFLPVTCDPELNPEDPANLKRFAAIVPFVDALLSEDPLLYEHLLDPSRPYPLGITGSICGGRERMLSAVRRAVRYGGSTAARPAERLLRVENIPWEKGFAELSRVVHECGRYPKTTDRYVVGDAKSSLHALYRHYADEYKRRGTPECTLEPFQLRALESLPGWEPYGVEGPYPWKECLAFLEQWLVENNGVPPMVNIQNGGYVGLEATPMERLSGALTCINQGDGKARGASSGFTVSAEKSADLDALCSRWGLTWRKTRDDDGPLPDGPPSFIQKAYAEFKKYLAANGPDSGFIQKWYPGYPMKHKTMTRIDLIGSPSLPPRAPARRKPTAAASVATEVVSAIKPPSDGE